MVYIPVSRLAEVKRAMGAFSRYWELGVSLSRLNLERMGLSKSSRPDHGRGVA